MRKIAFGKAAPAILFGGGLLFSALATTCNEQRSAPPVNTQPVAPSPEDSRPAELQESDTAERSQTRETQPEAKPPTTRPADTQPASRPEPPQPVSTYDSRPPYPVALYVKSPKEEQPGWLRIEALAEEGKLATAQGRFPEQNRIYVNTGNVRRIRIHVGHLPLRANERVILQIDGQGMVISRTRPFTTLELSPTGQWKVLKEQE